MDKSPAHHALMNYQQADEDGVMALVSRQAVHEVSDEIERLRAAVSGIAPWLSASLSPKELGGLGGDAGPEYRAACDAIFAVDIKNPPEN